MADTAEDVIVEFEKALLSADADAIAELYEDDAVYVVASMEIAANGRDEIRSVWKGLLQMAEPRAFSIAERRLMVDGDHAYAHMTGTFSVKWAESGAEEDVAIRATEVMHRGADGRWRYVVDHA